MHASVYVGILLRSWQGLYVGIHVLLFFQLQIIFFQILKYFSTVHIPLTKIVKSAAFFSLS